MCAVATGVGALGEDLSFRGKSKGSQEPMCWIGHKQVYLSQRYDFKGDLKHRIL